MTNPEKHEGVFGNSLRKNTGICSESLAVDEYVFFKARKNRFQIEFSVLNRVFPNAE